jgi:hypothetical protein
MIRLQRSMASGLNEAQPDPAAVIAALQRAVELEHATIPVYLYALYSLDEDKNPLIVDILRSVVIEEMLHMTLASNVLNALGGDTQVGNPGFVPSYPGPLPGGVEADLTVHLAPFSMTQLQTFLQIERPEDPLDFPVLATEAAAPEITIGQFYTAISKAIGLLGDGAFAPAPRYQVGPDLMDGAIVVTDVASAQEALRIIIEQGEGTSTSPEEIDGDQVAHYYRFLQIEKGRLLVPAPDQPSGWAYAGAPVILDPSGVYAAPVDPGYPTPYTPGSAQAMANDNFNYTYTSLLFALRDLFSGGNSTAQMNRSIGLMMSLKGQAKAMMAGIPNPRVVSGPTFQYQPTNPGG